MTFSSKYEADECPSKSDIKKEDKEKLDFFYSNYLKQNFQIPNSNLNQKSNHLNEPQINITNSNVILNNQNDNDQNYKNNEFYTFPILELAKLDDMINKPRWIIPVLPKGELEILIEASIDLCKRNLDVYCEPCQRFYKEGLTTSFTKILCDEAVTGWKLEIHKCIIQNCERLIELIVLKLLHDCFPLLDLLSIVLDPNNKFNFFTSTYSEPIINSQNQDDEENNSDKIEEKKKKILYAFSSLPLIPRTWLVGLINRFGELGGFDLLLQRFQDSSNPLSMSLISALIKPFGSCYELLTKETIEKYFKPIIEIVSQFLENLSDVELKKESKTETKNDALSGIIKSLKDLAFRIENQEFIKRLEIFRLKMILKLLQISSFNGKMNALNEINKVITIVSFKNYFDVEHLTPNLIAVWVKENKVLQIVLKDNLHQPQYVEKLEKIIRFIIKEKQLTLEDLDDLWAAQCGKHEAIVKNMHDLLAELAWDFNSEQLDHLFECFQKSWANANKKQREKLLELIRTLAEDDKDGVMAHKVLNLLWNLAHSDDIPTDIMDQALAAHIKILDYSCCQDRDAQKTEWLTRCIKELTKENLGNWVIPALKHIREICSLYSSPNHSFNVMPSLNVNNHQRINNSMSRNEVIGRLQKEHCLVVIISENLQSYMEKARKNFKLNSNLDPKKIYDNSRFSHVQEVQERLNFIRFLLKEGQLWLCEPQAVQIWKCLIQNSVYKEDREVAFDWFSQLMSEEPDLEPEINKKFFENHILHLDPILLTQSGIECFDKFFKVVNLKEGNFVIFKNVVYTRYLDLIGLDYLWRVVLNSIDEVSDAAIELLKVTYSNLSTWLQENCFEILEDFILSCMDRLSASYDSVSIVEQSKLEEEFVKKELVKMTRVLKVLFEYINQCDQDYGDDRNYLPMSRSFRGKNVTLVLRVQNQNRFIDDFEIETHGNETISNIKKQVLNKFKLNNLNMQINIVLNDDTTDHEITKDKKLVSHLSNKDRIVLTAKIFKSNLPSNLSNISTNNNQLSGENINSNSPPYVFSNDLNNVKTENFLPGVYMSKYFFYCKFLFKFADLGMRLKYKPLYINALEILKIMPIDRSRAESLMKLCKTEENNFNPPNILSELMFNPKSPFELCYTLGVIYSLLMPANDNLSGETLKFQIDFIKSGIALDIKNLLTNTEFFENSDELTKIFAFSLILKILKFVLTTVTYYLAFVTFYDKKRLEYTLQKGFEYFRSLVEESVFCDAAEKAALFILSLQNKRKDKFISQLMNSYIPDFESINAIMMFIYLTATGLENVNDTSKENLHHLIINSKPDSNSVIYDICQQSLQVLTINFILVPDVLMQFINDKNKNDIWQRFTIDLLLFSPEKSIRTQACEQFSVIINLYPLNNEILKYYINFLNEHLQHTVPKNYQNSAEFFQLFCKLLRIVYLKKHYLPETQQILEYEINLLKNVKEYLLIDGLIEEVQLKGHLNLTKELVMMLNSEMKYQVGCKFKNINENSENEQNDSFLGILIDEYIFTASKAMIAEQKLSHENLFENSINNYVDKTNSLSNTNGFNSRHNSLSNIYNGDLDAICSSPSTLEAAYDLIVALCVECVPNLRFVVENLIELFYSGSGFLLNQWEFLPYFGSRPLKGFVGLKNGGATCYMNSVLQQLYMIPEIRDGLLSVEESVIENQENFYNEEKEKLILNNCTDSIDDDKEGKTRKDYNVGVIKHVQALFGHLTLNKLQYYIPTSFWKHFKLWGEPINLREQHDALEFFNSLVDSIDEGLKILNYKNLMSNILGGSFADQKICKGCPHRYSREESFTTLNIDIRNHSNLFESLEQYVKGDLLEGANAYFCEKCNQKVDTVKRLCIKKLPVILTIQLKRFDYDWEKECAIKFNDYFEFPRLLDMEPYTVNGLAKIDGEIIENEFNENDLDLEIEVSDCSNQVSYNSSPETTTEESVKNQTTNTKYELCGIVVHSGEASGGHYYSYILHRETGGCKKWFKFDDCEVTECKLDEDEEMKNQCFGGDYVNEVFDQVHKRVSCRKQKRWWSAYILFYRNLNTYSSNPNLKLSEIILPNSNSGIKRTGSSGSSDFIIKQVNDNRKNFEKTGSSNNLYLKIPTSIRRRVQKQNIKFIHMKNQFNQEYFNFIKKLTSLKDRLSMLNSANEEKNIDSLFLNKQFSNKKLSELDELDFIKSNDMKILNTNTEFQKQVIKSDKETSLLCTQLLSKFLFTTCFRTKKSLRGSALDWFEILTVHLKISPVIRGWFAHNMLFAYPYRFTEYLLECVSADVRLSFARIIMFISHYSLLDGNLQEEIEFDDGTHDIAHCGQIMSDYIMKLTLSLLKREMLDYIRHLNQYLNLFYQYCCLGREERTQLIRLNVPDKFISAILDETIVPSLKCQWTDFGRLHQVVSILIRCCDITVNFKSLSVCKAIKVLPNPYAYEENYISIIQPSVSNYLYDRTYILKLIKESSNLEEISSFIMFCCWENQLISSFVIEELISNISSKSQGKFKIYLDFLYCILKIEDSLRNSRIIDALNSGVFFGDEKDEGLLEIILRHRTRSRNKAYQCIKFIVALFTNRKIANVVLDLPTHRKKWITAINWLSEELENSNYLENDIFNYSNCLSRSHSAKKILAKAIELCPLDKPKTKETSTSTNTNKEENLRNVQTADIVKEIDIGNLNLNDNNNDDEKYFISNLESKIKNTNLLKNNLNIIQEKNIIKNNPDSPESITDKNEYLFDKEVSKINKIMESDLEIKNLLNSPNKIELKLNNHEENQDVIKSSNEVTSTDEKIIQSNSISNADLINSEIIKSTLDFTSSEM